MRSGTHTLHSRLLGVGAYRPSRVVPNAEVCGPIDSTDAWIVSRSGIRTRRFASPEETLTEMAAAAGGKALGEAGVPAAAVSLVLVATMSHVRQAPSVSAEVAHRLGATSAGAVDVGAACAGFCYGLALAADAVSTAAAEHVLLIGVERMTDIVDPTDRSTAFLFGDGAGAVVVGPGTEPAIGPPAWGSDGSLADAIRQDEPWTSLRTRPDAPFPALRMAGPAVFRWSMTALAPVARRALDLAGVTVDELGAFVPHQANLRIVDGLARALELPARVAVARDVVDAGNTSAASVPLALERLLSSGEARGGDLALLLGFGAGLVFAGQVVRLP